MSSRAWGDPSSSQNSSYRYPWPTSCPGHQACCLPHDGPGGSLTLSYPQNKATLSSSKSPFSPSCDEASSGISGSQTVSKILAEAIDERPFLPPGPSPRSPSALPQWGRPLSFISCLCWLNYFHVLRLCGELARDVGSPPGILAGDRAQMGSPCEPLSTRPPSSSPGLTGRAGGRLMLRRLDLAPPLPRDETQSRTPDSSS